MYNNMNYFIPSRRWSDEVKIGNIKIGGYNRIAVQSMCNTHTYDIENSVCQIKELYKAGADLVRLTVPSMYENDALKQIHDTIHNEGIEVPLCADVHFNASIAFSAAEIVEKVRVNPGNFAKEEDVDKKFTELLSLAKEKKVAIRVGVNHGSLSSYMMDRWGDTPKGMVESALEFLRIAKREDFNDIVVSLKSSNPRVMVESYRLCAQQMIEEDMAYPLHLGVTEAGEGVDGRIRSAVGIGTLLADGLGDTIRVSLTEDPVAEIPVAKTLALYFEKVWKTTDYSIQYNDIPLPYDPYSYNRNSSNLPFVVGKGGDFEVAQQNWMNISSGTDVFMLNPSVDSETPIVVSSNKACWVGDIRYTISALRNLGLKNPIVLRKDYDSSLGDVDVIAAAEMGAILIDGIADGIWIEKDGILADSSLGYAILQATRLRLTKAEIISCPGCGRTQYDIQATVQAVKDRFSDYQGIKIAVMGCIVNGPGEMADADWGYVGAGGGKVTIYKSHEPLYRNVDQSEALDLLEKLIKDNNEQINAATENVKEGE